MRLGEAKRAQHLALGQRREPLLLLRRIAIAHQDGIDRAIGDADHRTGTAIASSDLFQHQSQRQIVKLHAAVFLRNANAIRAQRRQALVRLFGESVLLVPARGVRPQFVLRKFAHRIANGFLVGSEEHKSSSYSGPKFGMI